MNKIKRVKIINKFVKITQSGGELGKLNNSFFKLLFLVVFLNLLSFASFGEPYTENGVMYSFDTGTLTISKIGGDDKTKGEITQEVVQRAMESYSKDIASIEKVKIEAGITIIGDFAFSYCESLSSITIPEGVTSIGGGAFYGCSSLEKITVDRNNSTYKDIDGVLFTQYEARLICYPAGKVGSSYEIPEGVTSIGDFAFYGCSALESVTIPNSVTSIGSYAFYSCSALESVTIPNSVTSIGERAFYDCRSLTNMTIPEGVTSIGNWVFSYCSALTSVTIQSSVTSIGSYAFYECRSLTSIIIPEGVTSIGAYAFYNCSALTNMTIPESVTSIGGGAFSYCSALTNMTIPEGVTSIGDVVFYGCSSLERITVDIKNLEYKDINGVLFTKDGKQLICYPAGKVGSSYEIPEGVTSIGSNTFRGCLALTSVTIPNSVTSIGYSAFFWCRSLKSVIISNTVTSIGDDAFYNCALLNDVYFSGTEDEWSKITIGTNNDPLTDATIHYPGKTLTVNKVWNDGGNSGLRRDPTFVLYKLNSSGTYDEIDNGGGENDTKYVQCKHGNDYKKGDTWQYKFAVFNHIIGSTYAVGEKRMKGYTSDAYVD